MLQALHSIHNALLQSPKLDTQNLLRPAIIKLIQSPFRKATTRTLGRQHTLQIREILPYNLTHLSPTEIPIRNKEPLARRLGQLNSLDMRQRHIPHINPQIHTAGRDFLLILPRDEFLDILITRVQRVQAVQIMYDRAQDERGIDRADREIGLLLLDELPRRLLCECLGSSVTIRGVLERLGLRDRVPVFL